MGDCTNRNYSFLIFLHSFLLYFGSRTNLPRDHLHTAPWTSLRGCRIWWLALSFWTCTTSYRPVSAREVHGWCHDQELATSPSRRHCSSGFQGCARKPVPSRPSPFNGDCRRGIFRSFAGSEPFSTVEWRKVTAIHCQQLHFCKDHVETQKEQWEKDISRVHWCFAPDHSRGVRVAQWARIVSQFEIRVFHEWICYSVSSKTCQDFCPQKSRNFLLVQKLWCKILTIC